MKIKIKDRLEYCDERILYWEGFPEQQQVWRAIKQELLWILDGTITFEDHIVITKKAYDELKEKAWMYDDLCR